MAAQWFVIRGQKSLGPFTMDKLKELAGKGKVTQDDMVRREDMRFASPAHEIEGLFSSQKPRVRSGSTPTESTPSAFAAASPGPSPSPPTDSEPTTKLCPFCSETILMQAIKCKHCGSMLIPLVQQTGLSQPSNATAGVKVIQPSNPPKDPLMAAVLSGCCIAGLGQIVLGQVVKGVAFLLGAMALGAITGGLSIIVTWPLMGIDAYLVARKLKSGRAVTEWESFPSV